MTMPNQIIDAIKTMLGKQTPTFQKIYVDLAPSNCVRPSACVELIDRKVMDASRHTVQVDTTFIITIFDTTDDYGRAPTDRLLKMQDKVAALFRSGKLPVDNRSLNVKASSAGRDWDKAFVELCLSYYDDRDEPPDTTPTMETIHTEIKPKE